jgi:hypothetical protein
LARPQASKIFTTKDERGSRRATGESNQTLRLRAERFLVALPQKTVTTRTSQLTVFAFLRAASWFFVSFVVKSGAEAHSVLADDNSSVTRAEMLSPARRRGHSRAIAFGTCRGLRELEARKSTTDKRRFTRMKKGRNFLSECIGVHPPSSAFIRAVRRTAPVIKAPNAIALRAIGLTLVKTK